MAAWNFHPVLFLYELLQNIVIFLFSPKPPRPGHKLYGPRVAIIGAGLSGISAAAHCVGHGSDVVIFEAGTRKNLGGIWSRVNPTSSLQIDSIMYRFHPSVQWHKKYPHRARILEEIELLWHRYHLEDRTRFETPVTSIKELKGHGPTSRWKVNDDDSYGSFDCVIAAIGTCGDPKMIHLPNQEDFQGAIAHSSNLEGVDVRGRNVVVIGGGASAIEALEYAVDKGAKHADIISRVSEAEV